MDTGLDGRTVLVTGATGGIGSAVARAFSAHGARVALGYGHDARAAAGLAVELGADRGTALAVPCRIGEPGAAEATVATVAERWGRIDVLVTCAMLAGGLRPPGTRFEDAAADDWAHFVDGNVAHTLRLVQLVLPGMREARWGRVVLVSSVVARIGKPGREFYGTVKSGLTGFARSLAWDLRDSGVLVNTVSPGLTLTETVEAKLPPSRRAEEEAATPTGRLSRPEDVAAAALFLGSAANGNIAGEDLAVSGGR